MTTQYHQRGFTLVELIMVIVIMGVIGGMVSVFMKSPIDAYFASARRAALTDVADTAVRRIARDVRKALPNSLRPLSTSSCIEFIPTKIGGRYRAESPGDTLDFASADTSFEVLGDMGTTAIAPDQRVAAGDIVAVYNLGISGSDAYSKDNLALIKTPTPGAVTSTFSITADLTGGSSTGKQFPLASGSNRFHVIPAAEHAVSFVCTGVTGSLTASGDGSGTLYRYVRDFSASHSCPTTAADVADMVAAGATELARHVSVCNFVYNGTDLQRNATIRVNLSLTQSNETVSLYHEVHVSNTP